MSFNPFSLVGKKILVTGASSGIGRSIAVAISQMGANVIISGRHLEKLNETLRKMDGDGHQVAVGDLTDSKAVSTIVENLPKLDGIVHCAGIGHSKLCRQITADDIDTVLNVNFKAPVLLQAAILQAKKINKSASIIFVASLGYDYPNVGNAVYCASKGAIVSYANCLKLELAPRQIRVNCISPGMVWTDLIFHEGLNSEELKKDEESYLLKRYGQPEDIANLAIYLLSDASSWMTGTNIEISGGAPRL